MSQRISARIYGSSSVKCCNVSIITECRARTGYALLCGWPEYVDSNPLRRYAHRQLSGTMRRDFHASSPCSGAITNCEVYAFSGTAIMLPAGGCARTQQAALNFSRCDGYSRTDAIDDAFITGTTATLTATTKTLTWPATCSGIYEYTGSAVSTLTSEDTETMAEARVAAVWGAWGTFGGCPLCCLSSRPVRGLGELGWTFTASQFRLGIEEGAVGETYSVSVDYLRRPLGASEWVIAAAQTFSVVSTAPGGSHDAWPAHDVPQLAGYETTIANIRLS